MDGRYKNKEIEEIWSYPNKLALWQRTELAVMQAVVGLGMMPADAFEKIETSLLAHPIDIEWWKKRDAEIHHDLNAFIDERLRFISAELHQYFHKKITSYDTEEPAFATMLKNSVKVVNVVLYRLHDLMVVLAQDYRYTIMNGRTHGQEAEMQSFGKRVLTWIADIRIGLAQLENSEKCLKYSKISGAIGNYGSIDPTVEELALRVLGFQPYYGATQIMPRGLYAPVAQSLAQIVLTLHKIALDIRLGARSGRPLFHEPFALKQKGSSAMPHKKNTIITEQLEGMARMALGYQTMIMQNIPTWEERAIEQSCVERVAWPDLFHVTVHSIVRMAKVIQGLVVYPDNMLQEIVESRGCYASSEAKEFLKEEGAKFGLTHEDAYRIVQLAAFNAFEPDPARKEIRTGTVGSLEKADSILRKSEDIFHGALHYDSIRDIISEGRLYPMPDRLEADEAIVIEWNRKLAGIFVPEIIKHWDDLFKPSHLLAREDTLFREIIGQ